ncbi:hypothetical protein EYF80_012398 [Liparis tanakae]|uniref:Uncharacterized protein n=1 Tax=Liparis tanakae TaxID=230148 RepID=A0A4Z2IIM1_9TELE|nr:hypothetical protein EYF80_012398 [Liparis tanakae]
MADYESCSQEDVTQYGGDKAIKVILFPALLIVVVVVVLLIFLPVLIFLLIVKSSHAPLVAGIIWVGGCLSFRGAVCRLLSCSSLCVDTDVASWNL